LFNSNPELHLTISPKGGELSGAIFIPRARLEPEKITSSDTMSRDTLFVDEHDITADFPFHFDLAIKLGDDIQVH
jgi:autotransporter translocation and assembly factor TamB